jgi:hypothetical protein
VRTFPHEHAYRQLRRDGIMRVMRLLMLITALLLLCAGTSSAAAQALNPDFVWGRDYSFERLEATREVHDAQSRSAPST